MLSKKQLVLMVIFEMLLRQIVWFCLVGVAATVTHYFVALMCYEFVALNIYVGNVLGYVIALLISYFGHGIITFRQRLGRYMLVRFLTASITMLFLSQLILYGLNEFLKFNPRFSVLVAVIIIALLSFVVNRSWTFVRKDLRGLI